MLLCTLGIITTTSSFILSSDVDTVQHGVLNTPSVQLSVVFRDINLGHV